MAPLGATIALPPGLTTAVVVASLACVLIVVSTSRAAVVTVLVAILVELAAFGARIARPSQGTEILDFIAALLSLLALTAMLGAVVFGPGRVTVHRVLGAIAIYFNVATAFAFAYRVIDALQPGAFSLTAAVIDRHAIATLIYFSFSTLTTLGYGDIVPVSAFARSAATLEGVIGQLFPATLLARLITLELQEQRRPPGG